MTPAAGAHSREECRALKFRKVFVQINLKLIGKDVRSVLAY